MDLEGIMLSEISQTEKHNYYMTSLICGTNNTEQNHTHRYRGLMSGARDRGLGLEEMYKLLWWWFR